MEAARRKLGLPLIVAEWGGTELRELTPEDYPAVCTLVRETHGEGMSAEGISAGDFSAEGISAGDFSAEESSAGDFSAEHISVEDVPSETQLADPEY